MESVLKQTYEVLEIIIIDDGSTDGCENICDDYAKIDARIKVIHQMNGGSVSARKAGLEAATAEYIAFVDADDWIDLDLYKKLMSIMERYQVDVVISGHINDNWVPSNPIWKIPGSSCHRIGLYNKDDLDEAFYSKLIYHSYDYFDWGISPHLGDKLYKKSTLYPYFMRVDERIQDGDDSACIYPMLANVSSLYISGLCCYHHTYRQDSLCHKHDCAYFERLKILQDCMCEVFEKSEFSKVLMHQLDRFVFEMFMKNLHSIYQLPLNLRFEQYLFPYDLVERSSRIVLYGAGKVGKSFYKQIAASSYCKIVMWADQNCGILDSYGGEIELPEQIGKADFDYIIIAVLDRGISYEIKEKLLEIGISEKKIIWSEKYLYDKPSVQEAMGF